MKVIAYYKKNQIQMFDYVKDITIAFDDGEVWLDFDMRYESPKETLFLKALYCLEVDGVIYWESED